MYTAWKDGSRKLSSKHPSYSLAIQLLPTGPLVLVLSSHVNLSEDDAQSPGMDQISSRQKPIAKTSHEESAFLRQQPFPLGTGPSERS